MSNVLVSFMKFLQLSNTIYTFTHQRTNPCVREMEDDSENDDK